MFPLTYLTSPFPDCTPLCSLMFPKLSFLLSFVYLSYFSCSMPLLIKFLLQKCPSSFRTSSSFHFVHHSRSKSNARLPQAIRDPPRLPRKSLPLTHAQPNAGLVNSELNYMLPSPVTCWHIHYSLQRIPAGLSGVLRNPGNICKT